MYSQTTGEGQSAVATEVLFQKSTDESTNDITFTYLIPKELLVESTDPDVYTFNLNFKAYSGDNDDFEDNTGESMIYANYKVEITMGLQTSNVINGAVLNKSNDTQHIIYTNARIISDVVS